MTLPPNRRADGASTDAQADGESLADLLRTGLDVVFVGINPSLFSAARGHYYARPGNRFWPALSGSRLSASVRQALGLTRLGPAHDRLLLDHGFGFTDLVKRPTARAQGVAQDEFAAGVAKLAAKLEQHGPRMACLHGVTVWRPVARALTGCDPAPGLGLTALRIGATRVFVAPNPSGGNAHFTLAGQIGWYDRLAQCLAREH